MEFDPVWEAYTNVKEASMRKEGLSASNEQWGSELEKLIRAALKEIRFGTLSLVIQDGKVIQIDKSEKLRLK
jgi:hypothetical protein